MTLSTGEANLAVSRELVASFVATGLRHAVICPGSRSTPLALALATCSRVKSWVLVDERSAAFFALGMARQLGESVAILCTSGTAAANFLPAVVEASLSRVPLLVLTADRPPELRGWGAAQTIDQINLYGSHVKWFADLPAPEADQALLRHARAVATRAMQTAAAAPQGPVHINAPFREPLLPAVIPEIQIADSPRPATSSPFPVPAMAETVDILPDAALGDLAAVTSNEPKGIIVAGPGETRHISAALAEFSKITGFPILADPLSGARFGPHRPPHVIDSYDSFLRDQETAAALAPEVVIRIGAIPTSKPLQQFLTSHPGRHHVLIDPGPPRDPFHLATEYVRVDPASVLSHLADHLRSRVHPDPSWLAYWRDVALTTNAAIAQGLAAEANLSEGRVLAEVAAALPDAAALVVGNSMPVRDADTFIRGDDRCLSIVANRGANGIDGVTSSALGAAAVSENPTLLVVGDLSFFHDMNGLFAARQFRLAATIVVLNNNGGGIFSFLPQADALDVETFERLFGTPIDLDVRRAAELYGASYMRPATWQAFRSSLCQAMQGTGLSIIEVVTNRSQNLKQHRAIAARVAAALREMRGDEV